MEVAGGRGGPKSQGSGERQPGGCGGGGVEVGGGGGGPKSQGSGERQAGAVVVLVVVLGWLG